MEIHIYDGYARMENPKQQDFSMHIHHDSYELLYFISGAASYHVEGRRYPLAHGDLMLMRKGEAHHLVLNGNAPYTRIVVNFDLPGLESIDPEGVLLAAFQQRSLGKFNHYPAALFPDNQWQLYLQKLLDSQTPEQKLCYLLPLLRDLADCFQLLKNADTLAVKDRAAAVVKYINRHLSEELSLDFLAEHFYLSKTHLNRVFRQSTGTTVWNYITVKRLFWVRERMRGGEMPTKACLQCGFQDYNTFYRAYRQHFGVSPKEDTGYLDPTQEIFTVGVL